MLFSTMPMLAVSCSRKDRCEAVNAPRVHYEDGVVYAEPGLPVRSLEAAGHAVAPFRERNLFFGGVQAAERESGSRSAQARPSQHDDPVGEQPVLPRDRRDRRRQPSLGALRTPARLIVESERP